MRVLFQGLRVSGEGGRSKAALLVVALALALVLVAGVSLGLRSVSDSGEETPAPAELAGTSWSKR